MSDNFKKQQNRNNAFAFQRKFKGLDEEPAQLVKKADKKVPTRYIVMAIIYVAILIGFYIYRWQLKSWQMLSAGNLILG